MLNKKRRDEKKGSGASPARLPLWVTFLAAAVVALSAGLLAWGVPWAKEAWREEGAVVNQEVADGGDGSVPSGDSGSGSEVDEPGTPDVVYEDPGGLDENGDSSGDGTVGLDEQEVPEDAVPEGQESDDASLQQALDEYLQNNYEAAGLPGVAVAVVDSDGIRYMGTFGDCTSESDTFTIGSLSKSFTAVAIMQLVQEGAVSLDAPASLYVPGLSLPDSVTVRSLLNQTSGFGYYDSLSEASVGETSGQFSYSNANYDLLGKIIENVSGMSYAEYLDKNIFEPLGMSDSSATVEARAEALGHRNYFGFAVDDGYVHVDSNDSWGTASSGYVCSSVEDMATYLQMYLRGGEDVLDSTSVDEMFFSNVPDPDGDTFYGMGWTMYYWEDGEVVLSHAGQVENAVAQMVIIPGRDIGIIVLGDESDYFGGNAAFWELSDAVLDIAVGSSDVPSISSEVRSQWHLEVNLQLAGILVIAALPIALFGWWRRRLEREPELVSWAVLVGVHVILPIVLWWMPSTWEVKWRDLIAFVPDVALVLIVAIALLVGCGLAKAFVLVRRHRDEGRRRRDDIAVELLGGSDAPEQPGDAEGPDGEGPSDGEDAPHASDGGDNATA